MSALPSGGDMSPVVPPVALTSTWVDHLVLGADSLAQGVAWCEATLGVTPGPGGSHPLMGTHNRLLKIATERFPDAYLEIIAIDPAAPAPARPRFFGLDGATLQAALRRSGPRLLHCVARSTMLDMHRFGLVQVGLQPGEPLRMERATPAGRLAWQILVRADGLLPRGGALPSLIQWDGPHPAPAMPDSGVCLQSLVLRGLGAPARDVLRLRGVEVADGEPDRDGEPAGPALSATLSTPLGPVTLHGPGDER